MLELMDSHSQSAVIKVIGVGGGGGNAVKHMASCGIEGVDFICANTDRQALLNANVKTTLQIGCNITKGLGAGANPEVGYQAAMEDRDRIEELITGADMLRELGEPHVEKPLSRAARGLLEEYLRVKDANQTLSLA